MALIPPETIDRVRETVNIADYIGQIVALRKQGQNLFGLCPFHEEKTPSFSVNESKQIFQCFSCHRGGNVFKFVMEYDKLTFPEAVEKVADFAGISLGVTVSAPTVQVAPEVQRQKDLLQAVAEMAHHVLVNTEAGEEALTYLTKRGLDATTLNHFAIGYLPTKRTLVRQFLESKHASYDEMRASGLFTENDQGELFDRFSGRLLFPLKDSNGDVVGFSGRVLHSEDNTAKYLNSPETELFNKRDLLFNLAEAKREFQDGGAILFEGFMDVIAAWQAGVKNGIASMGTSLTSEQIGLLTRLTKRLTLCYDGDRAGLEASYRAAGMLYDNNRLETGIVVLPDGQDPDEFIRAKGNEAFKSQLTHVLTPIGFSLNYRANQYNLEADAERLAYIDEALKLVALVPRGVQQTIYLQQVAELTGVPTETLAQSLPQSGGSVSQTTVVTTEQGVRRSRLEKAQRLILHLALVDADVARELYVTQVELADPQYDFLLKAWIDFTAQAPDPTLAAFIDELDEGQGARISELAFEELPESAQALLPELLAVNDEAKLNQRLATIKQALTQATQLGDKDKATELTQQYFNLMRAKKAQSGD